MKYKVFSYIKNNFLNIEKSNLFINLKERIKWMIYSLIILRIGSFVPIYGINLSVILNKLINNKSDNIFINIFNIFSGGSLSRISIFSLGVMPYISASILMQLLTTLSKYFIKLKKNENNEKNIIHKYTCFFTILFSIVHSFITIINLNKIFLLNNLIKYDSYTILVSMLSLISGTMFLMWLSNQITKYGIGNGISIIMCSGIISNIPNNIKNLYLGYFNGNISIIKILFVFTIIYILIYFSVFIECSQRKIFVSYPKQYIFGKNLNLSSSYLPIKINMSGVMPAVFSTSCIISLEIIINLLKTYFKSNNLIDSLNVFKLNKILYIIFYLILIFTFCFIYTPLIINSKDTSDNLKKSGAFIYGIRPGIDTSNYIKKIINKLTFLGSLYISIICLIPKLLTIMIKIPLKISGTSLLIITIVIIEIITQIQTIIISTQYESILKKMNIK